MDTRFDAKPPPPPRTAYEAADLLYKAGEHVHVVAEGEALCYSTHCPPQLLVARP
jgi:hypothetical protein